MMILINNVGIDGGQVDYLTKVKNIDEYLLYLINVNLKAILNLLINSSIFCHVINISSLRALFSSPFFSIYSATKVFIDYFSRSIGLELAINIQILSPGHVSTKMTNIISPSLFRPNPNFYVKCSLRYLEIYNRTTGYWFHQMQLNLITLVKFISDLLNIDIMLINA